MADLPWALRVRTRGSGCEPRTRRTMNAEELLERLKAQLEDWRNSSYPYAYNTSPTGRSYTQPKYSEWVEIVSAEDFKTAFAAFSRLPQVFVPHLNSRTRW